jgi:putative IMPACT (imprinted ancient) family translation regulator
VKSAGAKHAATLASPARHALEVKHSRFLALAERADSTAQALDAIARLEDRAASHNCWAYRIGQQYRFNDDGEPGGTAGRPILQAIDSQGFDRVVVLVVRHFGGIKLGAGGLARAYGGCAAECLRTASKSNIIQFVSLTISCTFSHVSRTYDLLVQHGGTKRGERYHVAGLELEVEVPVERVASLQHELAGLSRGTITVTSHEVS